MAPHRKEKRQRDAVDERRVLISASAEGLRLRERARSVPRQMAERLPLGDASLAPLRNELRRLLLALEQV